MDFSNGSFLLFLLTLIFHAPFPTDAVPKLTNSAPLHPPARAQPAAVPKSDEMIAEVCKRTNNNTRCLARFGSIPQASLAKDYAELSRAFLEYAIRKATEDQNIIKEISMTRREPAIQLCANFDYDGTVGKLKSSLSELVEDPMTASLDADLSLNGPLACEKGLTEEKLYNSFYIRCQ